MQEDHRRLAHLEAGLLNAGPAESTAATLSPSDLSVVTSVSDTSDSHILAGTQEWLDKTLQKVFGLVLAKFIRTEIGLVVGLVTTLIFQVFGKRWLDVEEHVVPKAVGLFLWLFLVILVLAFGVVRHADCLAVRLGEPYGTLILTLSVIGIEAAMLAALMLTGEDNPTLARDTMFSVIMIVLTGVVGVTLLVGGIRNDEQEFNLSGALSYLRVLTPMAIISLVVPRFTKQDGGSVSTLLGIWLLCMSAGLYGVFIFLQTQSHTRFFKQPKASRRKLQQMKAEQQLAEEQHSQQQQLFGGGDRIVRNASGWRVRPVHSNIVAATNTEGDTHKKESTPQRGQIKQGNRELIHAHDIPHSCRRDHRGSIFAITVNDEGEMSSTHENLEVGSTSRHAILLFATMLPIVLLAKSMAKMIKYGIDKTHAPQELGGFFVAILVLSPEALTAIRAALGNQLQRTVNIALGSATSTIGMTVPTALIIAFCTKKKLELGLENLQITELLLTLVTCLLTFGSGKTNYLQGSVHLVLFISYIFLIFD